jgi:CBF1 interacting corepressor
MVAGLKFLSKKSFNPQNLTNQKNVWERQQQEKKEDRRIKERNEQLIRERDDEELAKARGDTVKLDFLYAAPPGMLETQKESTTADDYSDQEDDRKLPASDPNDMLHQRQPGDDDAAAAFRLLLSRPADEADADEDSLATGDSADAAASKSRYALQGSSSDVTKTKANLTALEKAVGRRKDSSNAITLDEQVQRFPALANAPRAQGMTSMDIGVSFKPLGIQIRNVRCMACQKWGHSKGDRDCEHQWDPFSGRASTLMTAKQHEEEKAIEKNGPLDRSEAHLNKSRRDRRDSSSSSEDSDSSSEESRRERKRRKKRKKHEDKAKRRKDSKHRKRSKSEDSEDQERSRRRKSSHKRDRKSHSRHDKSNK